MILSVRRLLISSLALGTLALAACGGDPVSPKAKSPTGPTLDQVFNGSSSRSDSTGTGNARM